MIGPGDNVLSSQRNKIVFINLPTTNGENLRTAFLPLPVLILVQALKQSGVLERHECGLEIVDLDLSIKTGELGDNAQFFDDSHAILTKTSADLFLVSTHGFNVQVGLEIASRLKASSPKAFIVMGGMAPTLAHQAILDHFPQIDLIVRGDGEEALPEVVDTFFARGDFAFVRGISYRDQGDVKTTPDRPRLDLSKRPRPAYEQINTDTYREHNQSHPYFSPDVALLETGRGCNGRCYFCGPAKMYGGTTRYCDLKLIAEEIRTLQGLGFSFFYFTQDNLDKSFIEEFCAMLEQEQLAIHWACQVRIHPIKGELVRQMAATGCRVVFLGMESANQSEQTTIRKRIDVADAFNRIRFINENGIRTICSFIGGLPGQNRQDLDQTLIFALELSAGKRRDTFAEPGHGWSRNHQGDWMNIIRVHLFNSMPGTDARRSHESGLRLATYSTEAHSVGSPVFNRIIRENPQLKLHFRLFPQAATPHSTEDEEFFFKVLFSFNTLIARDPDLFARLVASQGGSCVEFCQSLYQKMPESCFTRITAETHARFSSLVEQAASKL